MKASLLNKKGEHPRTGKYDITAGCLETLNRSSTFNPAGHIKYKHVKTW
jgi:hypothetical protein